MTDKLSKTEADELQSDIEMLTWGIAGEREYIRQMPLKYDMTHPVHIESLERRESDLASMEADLARALEKAEKAKALAERVANSLTVVNSFGQTCIVIKPRRSWVKSEKGVRCRKCKDAVMVGYNMSLRGGGLTPFAYCKCNPDDTRTCEVVK